jgi:hypothetical protein
MEALAPATTVKFVVPLGFEKDEPLAVSMRSSSVDATCTCRVARFSGFFRVWPRFPVAKVGWMRGC